MIPPIWREWYVILCLTTQQVTSGIIVAFPAILIPALTGVMGDDSDIRTSREEASWIAATVGITGPIGYIILPIVMQLYGRRSYNVTWNLFSLVGTITIAVAPNVAMLFFGRCIQGFSFCSVFVTSMMIGEYSHPKRRGSFIVLKVVMWLLGMVICHSLIFVMHWRQIAWLSVLPPVLGILSTMTWPESPSWLAYRGRYDDCIKSFEWLRGNDNEAREEIKELIAAQRHLRKLKSETNFCKQTFETLRSKDFWKPFTVSVLFILLMQSSGVLYLAAYIIEIMVKLSGDSSNSIYYIVGFDIIKVIATIVSFVVVKILNRRTLILLGGTLSCVILAFICIFHYLYENGTLDVTWLTPLLLILYIFICNVGVLPITVVIKGEIFPLKHKGIATTLSGILNALITMVSVKLTANMLTSLNVHGTFAVYLMIMFWCLIALYFIQPETKDRTLQEIENDFTGLKIDDEEDEKDGEMITIRTNVEKN